jgi:hypothetical protein
MVVVVFFFLIVDRVALTLVFQGCQFASQERSIRHIGCCFFEEEASERVGERRSETGLPDVAGINPPFPFPALERVASPSVLGPRALSPSRCGYRAS